MKILHLSNVAGRLGGGVSEVVHSLLHYQGKLGHRSNLWFLGRKSQIDEIANDNKIDQKRLTAIRLVLDSRFLIYLFYFLKLKKLKKKLT